jgi:hypothetical protein
LLKERWRSLLSGSANGSSAAPANTSTRTSLPVASKQLAEPRTRNSNGLDQFFASLRDLNGLSILDLGGASQANISYITNLGHRIYSEDAVMSMENAFGQGDFLENQSRPELTDVFLRQTLDFPDEQFDGALVWDAFQYMSPALLQTTVERLYRILRPQAYMLVFFHADEKLQTVPVYSYRIADTRTLSLVPRGHRKPAQFFNNRSLEKLFQRFESVKFFLTRDHLREIIVRR